MLGTFALAVGEQCTATVVVYVCGLVPRMLRLGITVLVSVNVTMDAIRGKSISQVVVSEQVSRGVQSTGTAVVTVAIPWTVEIAATVGDPVASTLSKVNTSSRTKGRVAKQAVSWAAAVVLGSKEAAAWMSVTGD